MATGDVKLQYTASSGATITLTTLAASTARQGIAWVNTTGSNYTDGTMLITLKTTSGTHGDELCCYAHLYSSPDGTNWSNPVTTSTDLGIAISTGMNLGGPVVINFGTSVTGLYAATRVVSSVAAAFGGQLPQQFGVIIENKTGVAFTNVSGDFKINFYPTFVNVST